jgi:hypothetical protein
MRLLQSKVNTKTTMQCAWEGILPIKPVIVVSQNGIPGMATIVQEWSRNGVEMVQEWNTTGMAQEWSGTEREGDGGLQEVSGPGMAREWNKNGAGMVQEWNGTGMAQEC